MNEILDYQVQSHWQGGLQKADVALWAIAGFFQHITNFCLLIMLLLTTATIVLRPFGISMVWIWPWTMVLFVWLCFFGFCAFFVRLKDVRIDFIVQRFGAVAVAATRLLADICTLGVAGMLLWQMPVFLAKSQGIIDGAILPFGLEVSRQALSVPLAFSLATIVASAVLDLLKMVAGLPENLPKSVVKD